MLLLLAILEEDRACYFRDMKIDDELYALAESGIDAENRPK